MWIGTYMGPINACTMHGPTIFFLIVPFPSHPPHHMQCTKFDVAIYVIYNHMLCSFISVKPPIERGLHELYSQAIVNVHTEVSFFFDFCTLECIDVGCSGTLSFICKFWRDFQKVLSLRVSELFLFWMSWAKLQKLSSSNWLHLLFPLLLTVDTPYLSMIMHIYHPRSVQRINDDANFYMRTHTSMCAPCSWYRTLT